MAYNIAEISKYFARGETITLDDVSGELVTAGSDYVTITKPGMPAYKGTKNVIVSGVKLIKEFDDKKRRWDQNLEKLIKAGAVKVEPDKWSSLTTEEHYGYIDYKHNGKRVYLPHEQAKGLGLEDDTEVTFDITMVDSVPHATNVKRK